MAYFVAGTAGAWILGETPVRWAHPVMFAEYERRLPEGFLPPEGVPTEVPLRAPAEDASSWREVHIDTDAASWHLVYVAGLIVVGLSLAVRMAIRRTGEVDRSSAVLATAGLPLVAVGGVVQLLTTGVPG